MVQGVEVIEERDAVAELGAQLDAEAAQLEAGPAADPGPAAPAVDHAAEAAQLVEFVAGTLGGFYPRTGGVLDAPRRKLLADAWAPVLAKYGLSMAGLFGRWGPEIGAAFATLPLVVPVLDAIKADREDRRRAEAAAAAAPGAPVQAPAGPPDPLAAPARPMPAFADGGPGA